MEQIKDKIESFSTYDLLFALVLLKAREAGLIDESLLNTDLGIFGGMSADLQKTAVEHEKGSLPLDQARVQIRKILLTGITTYVVRRGLDFVANLIKFRLPFLAPIVDGVNKFLQSNLGKIANKITSVVKTGAQKIKNLIFGS